MFVFTCNIYSQQKAPSRTGPFPHTLYLIQALATSNLQPLKYPAVLTPLVVRKVGEIHLYLTSVCRVFAIRHWSDHRRDKW